MESLKLYYQYLKNNKAVLWVLIVAIGGLLIAYYTKSLNFFIYHFAILVLSVLVSIVDAQSPTLNDEGPSD